MVQTIFSNNTGTPDAPQAYLVYLTFDEGFNLNESKSGIALIAHAKCSSCRGFIERRLWNTISNIFFGAGLINKNTPRFKF